MNTLYYGDNLEILRRYIKDETIDLIYLDPPFNSDRDYNVLFAEQDGSRAASQIEAFKDTWSWDQEAEKTFSDLMFAGGKVADVMKAFRTFLSPCDMLAYLTMMAPRLVEMRRVMKPTASIYLHCDNVASHYLKLLMDAVFIPHNFRSQVIWKRTYAHGNVSRNYGCVTDMLLFYSKGGPFIWNQIFRKLSPDEIKEKFPNIDSSGRRWQSVTLRNPGKRPNLHYPYTASNGVTYHPHPNGWSCNPDRMRKYDREGRLHFPSKPEGALRLIMFADESQGERLQNLWIDIPPIAALAAERLGYPTQKPLALLERIIQASSNEGAVILDPFCGCGTAVVAAEKLKRQWIGIDITHLAVNLMKYRLRDSFGEYAKINVIGEPTSLPDAEDLAKNDPYQFQWWALGLVGARPVEQKKGADKGIDGKIVFQGDLSGQFESVIISVKAGHVTVSQVRDLKGVLEREKAGIGVMISMEHPTKPMKEEAATAGLFSSSTWNKRYPKIQLLTIAELLSGTGIDMPPIRQVSQTFIKAGKVKDRVGQQDDLPQQDAPAEVLPLLPPAPAPAAPVTASGDAAGRQSQNHIRGRRRS
jgi:site-specific DNA-methyltransferase (adenine-specific)